MKITIGIVLLAVFVATLILVGFHLRTEASPTFGDVGAIALGIVGLFLFAASDRKVSAVGTGLVVTGFLAAYGQVAGLSFSNFFVVASVTVLLLLVMSPDG
ncbi:hypothetical protein AUG19_03230 [archaeon 13_1_20CM_2_54_9]|nr:MAG: hypothetical protein AUG19_03230 [archaeon 13_1_20CM_2_54_9]